MAMSPENLKKLTQADWYSWIMAYAQLPSQDKYTFKGYEYLQKIVDMNWQPGDERYVIKSAQCGVSELVIQWMLWLAERGLPNFKGIGYVFPAVKQLQDHMKARVFPILEMAHFHPKVKEANLGFIRYNNVPLYFRGSQIRDLKSFPADAIIADEFDEFEDPIAIIPTLQARFNASQYKWLFGLSTPTFPDVGIDRATTLCSQYNWYINCDQCGHKFSPLNEIKVSGFENCVVRAPISNSVGFLCPKCKDLTKTCGAKGDWEKDINQQNQRTSFSISRVFLATATLDELLFKYEEALNIQEFYNSDLGLPYSPPNSRLSRTDITDAALGDVENKKSYDKATWCGVDVGKICYYCIAVPTDGNAKQVIAYGTCKFDELNEIFQRYSVKYLVIDLRPYEQEVKKVLRGNRGYYACDFNTGHQEDWYRIIKADTDTIHQNIKVVKACRTQSCDNLIQQLAVKKKYIFPGQVKGDNDFITQMCAPMRIDKANKDTGEVKAIYKSSSKKDHYFFAMTYLNLAFNLKKSSFAKIGGLFL